MGKRRDSPDRWPGARPLLSPLVLGTLLAVACGTSTGPGTGNEASADGAAGVTGDGGRGAEPADAEPGAEGGASLDGASDASSSAGGDGSPVGLGSDSGSEAGGQDGGTAARTYTTHFPLTENPISEGSNWINGQTTGIDWHDVSTTPGLAIGHQSGKSYTDGTALLTGAWGPTQSVEATVHTVNQNDACYQEVEMRLRSALSAHSCTGYEISFKASKTSSAYLIIVRWNGAVGDFTMLQQYSAAQYGVADGDKVKATITGNVITAYLNDVKVGTATDGTYAEGSPGMGFNLETGDSACVGTNGDYGFTSLTATGQ